MSKALRRALRQTKRRNPEAYALLVKAQHAEARAEQALRDGNAVARLWWTQEATEHLREATRLIKEQR